MSILPLETVIQGESVELLPKGSELIGLCPFHQERTASFLVVPKKQIFRCFGCGAGGNIFNFIKKYQGINFINAVVYLCKKYDIPYPKNRQRKRKKRRSSNTFDASP